MIRPSPIFLGLVAVTVVGGVLAALYPPLLADGRHPVATAGIVLLVLGGWALSLTLHEFGHAIVAYRGGDREVAAKGYLTMDIRRYTDPVFSLVIPLVILAIGGIPLPGGAVWINQWALRSRRVSMWVSLAGPLSNLAIGLLLIIAVTFIPMSVGLYVGLAYLAMVQVIAFVLNILPVPGLDGYGALEPYLSPKAHEFGMKARPWAPLVLFALIIGVPFVGQGFWYLSEAVFGLVGGDVDAGRAGMYMFMFWR